MRTRTARQSRSIRTSAATCGALLVITAVVTLFWAAFDQQGNTLLLWASDLTDRARQRSGPGRARFPRSGSWRSTR